jgi:hypothetical protein
LIGATENVDQAADTLGFKSKVEEADLWGDQDNADIGKLFRFDVRKEPDD